MRHSTDNNQADLIRQFKQIGASVLDLSAVGGGCPDIAVGYRGVNYFFEIKRPIVKGKVFASQIVLTNEQIKWHSEWNGRVAIIRSFDEAMKILNER